MKFTANRKELADALSSVSLTTPKEGDPYSGAAHIMAGDAVRLDGADGPFRAWKAISATDVVGGECLVQAAKALSFCRQAVDDDVIFSCDGEKTTFVCGAANWSAPVLPAPAFVASEELPNREAGAVMPGPVLAYLIKTASLALYEARVHRIFHAIEGLHFHFQKNKIVCVGTNQAAIAAVSAEADVTIKAGLFGVTVPAKGAKVLLGAVADADAAEVAIDTDGNVVSVKSDLCGALSPALVGRYPPWEELIDKDKGGSAYKIDPDELIRAVRIAMIGADLEGFSASVSLKFDDCSVTVIGASQTGKSEVVIAHGGGKARAKEFRCNGRYLLNALTPVSGAETTVRLTDGRMGVEAKPYKTVVTGTARPEDVK